MCAYPYKAKRRRSENTILLVRGVVAQSEKEKNLNIDLDTLAGGEGQIPVNIRGVIKFLFFFTWIVYPEKK